MNERKGWIMVCIGIGLLVLACLGTSATAYLWTSTVLEGILG